MKHHISKSQKKKGSILVIGMIFGLLLVASAGILLNYGSSEKTVNERHFLRLEAQAAAEAAADYGFAELQNRWLNETNFPTDALKSDPLKLPTSVTNFFNESNVDVSTMEVAGGQIDPGKWIYINPKDPANMLDPQKRKHIFARDVEVYSKATAHPPKGMRNAEPISAYCAQIFQVRDAPLFTHAVFYNMDMEFHPGPRMDIQGPVHSNGNIYVQSGGGLYFHSNLMAAGNIWHWYKATNSKSTGHLSSVKIVDSDGNFKDMYKGSGSKKSTNSYYDSFMGDDWKQAAEDRWDGTVASYDHEVPVLKQVNIKDYVPAQKKPKQDLENHAYALIEPQLSKSDPDYKGAGVQKQQFSYKAGLLLRVVEDKTTATGYDYDFYKYKRNQASDPNSAPILAGNGKPVEILLDKTNLPATLVSIYEYKEKKTGMYDSRQNVKLDVIDVDVGLLRQTVDSKDPGYDPAAWNGSYSLNKGGQYDWNGIMYVEIPYDTKPSKRVDKVKVAEKKIAVRLANGSILPSPSGAPDRGFTFATNAPLYVIGNYNADGVSGTGSSTKKDSASEIPAAIMADSVTILSSAWQPGGYDTKTDKSAPYRKAKFTEVSTALLTGISPTLDKKKTSGGVHNFPRFLEDWSGVEFRYRGSMIALFESESHWKQRPSDWSKYYRPPIRNWGFSDIFQAGEFPPGTPMVRDFRRRHFRHITEAEYAAYTNP